jgi:hypothetical protein
MFVPEGELTMKKMLQHAAALSIASGQFMCGEIRSEDVNKHADALGEESKRLEEIILARIHADLQLKAK